MPKIAMPGPGVFPGADVFPGWPSGVLMTPTEEVYTRAAGRGLFVSTSWSKSLWQDADGVWHLEYGPTAEQQATAQRFYRGGYRHPLDNDDVRALITAGFADYIYEE